MLVEVNFLHKKQWRVNFNLKIRKENMNISKNSQNFKVYLIYSYDKENVKRF